MTIYSLWMILAPFGALAWAIMALGDRLRGVKIEDVDHFSVKRVVISFIPNLALFGVSIITPITVGTLFWTGCALLGVSVAIYLLAIGAFVKARRGVTAIGIYRLSRNPMYVAIFIMLAGLCLMAWQASPLTGLLAVVVSLWNMGATHWAILTEERFLSEKYGEDYLSYKRSVRRYLG